MGILDHRDEEGLTAGHIEGIDQPLQRTEGDDLPEDNDMRECERRRGKRLNSGGDLGPHQELATIEALDPDACNGSDRERNDLAHET